jgi:tRNA G10  N-methylase Trm11
MKNFKVKLGNGVFDIMQDDDGLFVLPQELTNIESFGTALKPSHEPIVVARKPLSGTVVETVLKWGTGGINIDGCRVETNPDVDDMLRNVDRKERVAENWKEGSGFKNENNHVTGVPVNGRFPANFIHDGSDEVVGLFPNSKSTGGSGEKSMGGLGKTKYGKFALDVKGSHIGGLGDSGSAARFFYCAKPSKSERNFGLGEIMLDSLEIIMYLCENNKETEIWKDRITIQEEQKVRQWVDMGVSVQKAIEGYGIQTKSDLGSSILSFGNKILEKSLMDSKSITEMKINSTISQQTLSLLRHYTTKEYTQDVLLGMMDGGNLAVSVEKPSTLMITINEKMGFLLGVNPVALKMQFQINKKESTNFHSTVKPITLMRYLCRLVTPPNGTVLDPFTGSGTTGVAAKLEGFSFIGIEMNPEYVKIAEARIGAYKLEDEQLRINFPL